MICALPEKAAAADLSSKAGQVQISTGWLNVRSSPGSGTAVSRLQKGSYITLISRNGDWWKVEYAKGKFGYCHSDYIREISSSAKPISISSGYLNVRSGTGTGYQAVGKLNKGEIVLSLSESGGWSRILYQGNKTGYVSSRYLSGAYPAVSVSVSSMKQMDSRWAEKIVGESGKTFAQIGCATTAIAMVESHRRNTVIYPDEMARQLRYTSSGNVYWPAFYQVITSPDNYLQKIYQRLSMGEPVLLGMKNRYGSQHWVVVTGYSGGNSLTASGFQILDPGTNYRTNLQQFIQQYPTFYKYFIW